MRQHRTSAPLAPLTNRPHNIIYLEFSQSTTSKQKCSTVGELVSHRRLYTRRASIVRPCPLRSIHVGTRFSPSLYGVTTDGQGHLEEQNVSAFLGLPSHANAMQTSINIKYFESSNTHRSKANQTKAVHRSHPVPSSGQLLSQRTGSGRY